MSKPPSYAARTQAAYQVNQLVGSQSISPFLWTGSHQEPCGNKLGLQPGVAPPTLEGTVSISLDCHAAMANSNFYQVLHVHPDAPDAIIQASYRTLMQKLKHHPDLGGSHSQAALINEAYATLSNPTARAAYDRLKFGSVQGNANATQEKPQHPVLTGAVTEPYTPPSMLRCLFCNAGNHEVDECDTCSSPLAPVAQVPETSSSKRLLERIQKLHPVTLTLYWPGSPVAAQSLDISPRGIRFVAALALREQDIVKIDCSVCTAVARIAHVKPDHNGFSHGAEFLTLKFKQPVGTFISTEV